MRAKLRARRLRSIHREQRPPHIAAHFPRSHLKLQPRRTHLRDSLRLASLALASRLDREVQPRLDDPRRNPARAAVVAGLERQHGIGPLSRRLHRRLHRLQMRPQHREVRVFLHRLRDELRERSVLRGKPPLIKRTRSSQRRERLSGKVRTARHSDEQGHKTQPVNGGKIGRHENAATIADGSRGWRYGIPMFGHNCCGVMIW